MSNTPLFNVSRVPPLVRDLCRPAALYAIGRVKQGEIEGDLRAWRQLKPAGHRVWYALDRTQSRMLAVALRVYAEALSPGPEITGHMLHLAGALEDFYASTEAVRTTESVTEKAPVAPVIDEQERRLQERRDDIFRHIVGNPARMSIWGTPEDESVGDVSPPGASESPEAVVIAREFSPAVQPRLGVDAKPDSQR